MVREQTMKGRIEDDERYGECERRRTVGRLAAR